MKDHVKSRHGCLRCKHRKVKCDETLPSCRRCLQRREVCSYLAEYGGINTLQSPRAEPPPSARRGLDEEFQPRSGQELQDAGDSYLEDMALVHQFLTSTYKTLWNHPKGQLIWRDFIFQTGLNNPVLLHGLLATAALQKIALASSQSPELEETALRKQTAALAGFRAMLHGVQAEQYVVAYPMSLLVSYWAFASKSLPGSLDILTTGQGGHITRTPDSSRSSAGALDSFLILLRRIQPTKLVFAQFRDSLLQGVFAEMAIVPREEDLPELTESEASFLDQLDLRLKQTAFPISSISRNSTFTIRYLYRIVKAPEWLHLIAAWPIQFTEMFIDMVKNRDHAALTILGYWSACFSSLDDLWWAAGWSNALLVEIRDTVQSQWLELVEWPCKCIGL